MPTSFKNSYPKRHVLSTAPKDSLNGLQDALLQFEFMWNVPLLDKKKLPNSEHNNSC